MVLCGFCCVGFFFVACLVVLNTFVFIDAQVWGICAALQPACGGPQNITKKSKLASCFCRCEIKVQQI